MCLKLNFIYHRRVIGSAILKVRVRTAGCRRCPVDHLRGYYVDCVVATDSICSFPLVFIFWSCIILNIHTQYVLCFTCRYQLRFLCLQKVTYLGLSSSFQFCAYITYEIGKLTFVSSPHGLGVPGNITSVYFYNCYFNSTRFS